MKRNATEMTKKKVLVVGSEKLLAEFQQRSTLNGTVQYFDPVEEVVFERESSPDSITDEFAEITTLMARTLVNSAKEISLDQVDIVFDLEFDDIPDNFEEYLKYPHLIVFGRAVKKSLAEIVLSIDLEFECTLFGINSIPTFINRPLLEVSLMREEDRLKLAAITRDLGIETEIVADDIGMVTPRIVFMIINEAYFLVGEGSANRNDVDRAMKLGTNYPMGPFEWAAKIGLHHIVSTLTNLHLASGDSRYKIAPLLRREYLREAALSRD